MSIRSTWYSIQQLHRLALHLRRLGYSVSINKLTDHDRDGPCRGAYGANLLNKLAQWTSLSLHDRYRLLELIAEED